MLAIELPHIGMVYSTIEILHVGKMIFFSAGTFPMALTQRADLARSCRMTIRGWTPLNNNHHYSHLIFQKLFQLLGKTGFFNILNQLTYVVHFVNLLCSIVYFL
jgi:hypothetical protein